MDFTQIALLLVVASIFGVIAKLLKQPLVIGYILAGFILAAFGVIAESSSLQSFGEIGVTLLLFLLGMEMDIDELPEIGRVAFISGIGQILLTFTASFFLAKLLSFDNLTAIYMGAGLSFSSTIIVVKLLSEKKDLSSLYGKITVGILLVQDLVAIFILMFLSGVGRGDNSAVDYLVIALKGVLLFALALFLSKKILPKFFEKLVVSSQELLFIVSIAWALGFAELSAGPFGFSLEIGGFLAGISLSDLSEHLQIASRTKPIRDFFLVIFFLLLGTNLIYSNDILAILPTSLLLAAFVIFAHFVIVMTLLGILGYRKRTAFLSSISLSQVSEFSLILVSVGLNLGHLNTKVVGVMTMVGVVTMTISTYLVLKADIIYKKIQKYLTIFEIGRVKERAFIVKSKIRNHVVLVGCDRTGRSLTKYLKRKGQDFVIVDFNPEVHKKMTAQNFPVVFGDINDPEVIEASNLNYSRLIISTIGNVEDNLTLLEYLRFNQKNIMTIFTATTKAEGLRLYEAKATYVIVPEIVAGEHIRHVLDLIGEGTERLKKMGKSHFERLIFT